VGTARPWEDVQALHHPGMSIDDATWTASFRYELRGPRQSLAFTETVAFPPPERLPDEATRHAFERVLHLLYVAAGTSYYKIAAPRRVVLDSVPIAEKALPWTGALYRHGMAEFAYTNGLPHVLEIDLASSGQARTDDVAVGDITEAPPLVPVGGGKDSIVTVETLRSAGFGPTLFAVNPNDIIRSVTAVTGLPTLDARRTLDRQLFELNRLGAYNGHVPVTAINSLIGVATAVLHNLGPLVMSNESSASVPNLVWHGHPVNHQWSKGIEAEQLLREALTAQAGIRDGYFSLLRPLSELHIAKLFARSSVYDAVMTSCNAAFKLENRSSRWCANCPKCRFVFLALAPFMTRDRLVRIFGSNMFDDATQLPGYRALLGISAHKPFECVGETEESIVALRLAAEQPEWSDTAVVRQLCAEIPHSGWPSDAVAGRIFGSGTPHFIPPRYERALVDSMAALNTRERCS
jgi:hypothetical protein